MGPEGRKWSLEVTVVSSIWGGGWRIRGCDCDQMPSVRWLQVTATWKASEVPVQGAHRHGVAALGEHPWTTAARLWTGGRTAEEGQRGGRKGKGHICECDGREGWGSPQKSKKWRVSEARPKEGLKKRSHCRLQVSCHVTCTLVAHLQVDSSGDRAITRFLVAESVTEGSQLQAPPQGHPAKQIRLSVNASLQAPAGAR